MTRSGFPIVSVHALRGAPTAIRFARGITIFGARRGWCGTPTEWSA